MGKLSPTPPSSIWMKAGGSLECGWAIQFHGEQNSYLDVCVMKKNLLERLVSDLSSRNLYSFSRDLLQGSVGTLHIQGYEFTGFARKVCSLKSFYASNMELLSQDVRKALFFKGCALSTQSAGRTPCPVWAFRLCQQQLCG